MAAKRQEHGGGSPVKRERDCEVLNKYTDWDTMPDNARKLSVRIKTLPESTPTHL